MEMRVSKSKSRVRRVKSTGRPASDAGTAAHAGNVSTIASGQADAMEEYLKGAKPRLIARVQHHDRERSHFTPFIAEMDLSWDETIDEGMIHIMALSARSIGVSCDVDVSTFI
jgi:hypothetical protein